MLVYKENKVKTKCEINAKHNFVRKFREMVILYAVFYCSVCGPIIRQADCLGMMFYFSDIKTYT